jgi:hypothetical protein
MDNTNPLSFIFNGNDPNVNQQLRQRIALAMMSKQKRYPRNLGEGLSAIGDSLGEMGTMRQLLEADKAATASGNARADELLGTPPGEPPAGGAPARAAYTPPADTEPEPEPAAPNALARSAAPPPPAPGSLPPTGEPGNTGATTFPPPGGYPRMPVLDQKNFNSIDAMAPNAPPALARGVEPQAPSYDAPSQYDPQSDPRRAIAMELLKQGRPGQPQTVGSEPSALPAPPPGAAVVAPPQRPSVADYGQTPVLAPTPVTPPQDPRQAVTEALAPKPPVVAFDGPGAPPPPAPPPQQIRQAPPVSPRLPPPGYVPQTPNEVVPPQPMAMSPTEAKLRDALARNPNDEQLARRLSPVIQTLEANRTAENTRRIEQYKADLQLKNSMTTKVEDARMSAPERAANAEKTQQEIRAGNLPKPIDIGNNRKVMQDPVTGLLTRPKVEGDNTNQMPDVTLTEDQRKTLTFHGWASLANVMLQDKKTADLLAHGASQEALGKVPVFGNQLQQDEYRRAKNAANNFVLAFMRSTSGAAYGPKEAEDHARAMLPKQGDDPKTLADKAAQRNNFVQTLYGGLGPGREVADYLAKERKSNGPDTNSAAMDAKQQKIDEEMQHVKPLAFGDKRTNKKTGATRTWNGSHWVEM